MNTRIVLGTVMLFSVAAVSGEQMNKLVRGVGADHSGQWELTSQQVAYIDTWIGGRALNCLAGIGSPPNPAIHLDLVRSDGTRLELGLYDQPGYARVVETRVGKNLCQYQGRESEVAALREAVSRPE